MITLDTKRTKIQEFLEDAQTADSYFIGTAEVHWIPGVQEWMLKLSDGTTEYESNGCGDLIQMIDDADIEAYYEELLEDWFDEEAAE